MKQNEISKGYTWPACIRVTKPTGIKGSEYGNYVIINDEGWIVTARHVLLPESLEITGRWMGHKNATVTKIVEGENDLAFAKLSPFDSKKIPNYPIFGAPSLLKQMLVLYHAGYLVPSTIAKTGFEKDMEGYDKYPGKFVIQETRCSGTSMHAPNNDKTGNLRGQYTETLSRIANGHSGGSLIDRNAHVYGILSSSSIAEAKGYSISLTVLRGFMDKIGISYQSI